MSKYEVSLAQNLSGAIIPNKYMVWTTDNVGVGCVSYVDGKVKLEIPDEHISNLPGIMLLVLCEADNEACHAAHRLTQEEDFGGESQKHFRRLAALGKISKTADEALTAFMNLLDELQNSKK